MIDLTSNFIGYGIVSLIVLGVIALIPRWIVLSTESENDPDHIYSIFMEESGYRGHKVLSAAGCLFPLIEVTKTSNEIEGLVMAAIIFVACFFYHLTVYKGYPVFNVKLKVALAVVLSSLTLVSILTRLGFVSSGVFIFIMVFSGLAWGGYSVYRRSKLIRISRR